MYKSIINGIEANLNKKNNIKALMISNILKIFILENLFSENLNFRLKKEIFEIKSIGKIIDKMLKKIYSLNNSISWYSFIIGNAATKIAHAGVGNPVNWSLFVAVTLYFASLIAENIGIRNDIKALTKAGSFTLEIKKTSGWLV